MEENTQLPLSTILSGETMSCPHCSGKIFRQSLVFKRLSKIILASPVDKVVPIPVIVCDNQACGLVYTDLLEEPLKSELSPPSEYTLTSGD